MSSPQEVETMREGYVVAIEQLDAEGLIDPHKALAKGLHDGGYIKRAETVLAELLERSSSDQIEWLAKIIHDKWKDLSGSAFFNGRV